jgi:hypothetical protein
MASPYEPSFPWAAALPAQMKERLPDIDDAFLSAIPAMSADAQTVLLAACQSSVIEW